MRKKVISYCRVKVPMNNYLYDKYSENYFCESKSIIIQISKKDLNNYNVNKKKSQLKKQVSDG